MPKPFGFAIVLLITFGCGGDSSSTTSPRRLHDLRHSCATLLLDQGVNPRVVMETLGHSQVSLTLNTYSHVLPALQRDAAARMNAVFER